MPVILVVDDEAVVLQIARLALERSGHSVVTARSATEAFAAVEKLARVDVLIVDHSLTPDRGRTTPRIGSFSMPLSTHRRPTPRAIFA
jgi:CheY-like chemotaxis protein